MAKMCQKSDAHYLNRIFQFKKILNAFVIFVQKSGFEMQISKRLVTSNCRKAVKSDLGYTHWHMSTAVFKLETSSLLWVVAFHMTTNSLFCKQTSQSLQYFKGKPTAGISCVQVPMKAGQGSQIHRPREGSMGPKTVKKNKVMSYIKIFQVGFSYIWLEILCWIFYLLFRYEFGIPISMRYGHKLSLISSLL